jgi:subtilase family serine protease
MKSSRQNTMSKKGNSEQNLFIEVTLSIFFSLIIVFSFLVLFTPSKNAANSARIPDNQSIGTTISADVQKETLIRESD